MGLEKWSDWHKGKTHSAADHRLSAAGKAVFQFTMLTLWQKKALRPQAAPRGMPPQAAAFHTLYIYMEHPHPLSDFKFCPHCGGDGILEDENSWCCYVTCMDCGAHTAQVDYHTPDERMDAAKRAATLWNIGKVVSSHPCE